MLLRDHDRLAARQRDAMAAVAAGIPAPGLRSGLTPDGTTDTLRALTSPETYDLVTTSGGYRPAESGLECSLIAALCQGR